MLMNEILKSIIYGTVVPMVLFAVLYLALI